MEQIIQSFIYLTELSSGVNSCEFISATERVSLNLSSLQCPPRHKLTQMQTYKDTVRANTHAVTRADAQHAS